MDKFLSHETSEYPPPLLKCGDMRFGNKPELVKCIEMLPTIIRSTEASSTSGAVLEGSVLVNMGKPKDIFFFLSIRKFWLLFFKKSVFEHRNLNFRQISIKLWEDIHIYGLFR